MPLCTYWDKILSKCIEAFTPPDNYQSALRFFRRVSPLCNTLWPCYDIFTGLINTVFYVTLDPFLGMVAMALSGYTAGKTSLWRDHCLQLCKKVGDRR